MLQRAASNAYSWWWASHIRTKQSKWLEENLHDMEENVKRMLKIIENDGDSFVQRVEMYYRKRPELINFVEDSYRAYRALAERYDHLSKDLQRANHTIATVFPEQVQLSMDDDDDEEEQENMPTTSTSPDDPNKAPKPNIPKVPTVPMKERGSLSGLSLKKGQLNRTVSSDKAAAAPPSSGLSKEEAQEEIDKLQKEILGLQTEKEFIQSVYERCYAKCFGIENQITDMQSKVCSLQDEFSIGNVIDDNEARTLMASTALKSCQETLVKLQQEQEKSAEEAEVENQRIKEVHQKLTTLKSEVLSNQSGSDEQEAELENIEHQCDIQLLQEKIKNELDADLKSSLTMMQLADRIDELVEKVVNLETEVSSQGALVNRLRSETDGFQEQVKTLEEDKETLKQNSEATSNKLKELGDELNRLKNLNRSIKYQNSNLQTHFTETSCNIDQLSEKLQTVKREEEFENPGDVKEVRDYMEANINTAVEEHVETQAPSTEATEMEHEEKNNDVTVPEKHLSLTHDKEGDRKYLSETETTDIELEEIGTDEEEDEPNWRRPRYTSSLEEREKILLEEYSLVLKNYKEVRKKLGDVEKKNRDGFFELTLQIRELKNALAARDEEIQSLRKTGSSQKNQDEFIRNLTRDKYSNWEGSPDSMTQAASTVDNLSTISSPQQPVFNSEHEHQAEHKGRPGEVAKMGSIKTYPAKEFKRAVKAKSVDFSHPVSVVEEKIRSNIDELLEENLEFWLRFSTSFHQIQKFQTSVQDLKVELSKLKENMKPKGRDKAQSLVSEARPIYKHLREIQTDLTLWLENNSVLKDELQSRDTSLGNIQEEISRISGAEDPELTEYQAAKFQGEVMNMKHESNRVMEELRSGMDHVNGLKDEVEKIVAKLDEELGISASQQKSSSHRRARIPLRSFLFGVKLKRYKPQPQKQSPST